MKLVKAPKLSKKVAFSASVLIAGIVIVVFGPFGGKSILAAQFGRPISDITVGGLAPTPVWSNLDESSPDGTTSEATVTSNGGNKTSEVLLSPLADPISATGHIMSIYVKKTSNRSGDVVFYLYQGATLIATGPTTTLTTSYAQIDYTLSSAEANAITDYTNLRIRVTFVDNGGGAPGTFNWSWAQLQVPDVANFVQYGYRWRSDDGNETSGSSLVAENTVARTVPNTPIRLRLLINNTGGDQSYSFRLEYNAVVAGVCSGAGWTVVPDVPTTQAFDMVSTANYVDQAATTNAASGPGVLSDPGGSTFIAGKVVESTSNTASSVSVPQNRFTELEYAFQANSNVTQSQYCFRVTNAGTALDSYAQIPTVTISYPPEAPVIYSVSNNSVNASSTPTFQIRSKDANDDYVKYVIEICPTNSWPCASGGITYDQTSSQTCWDGQDAQSLTAYQANNIEVNSTMATCTVQNSDQLLRTTQYYFRAKSIDPGDSNTYSPYSSVNSFTTASLEVLIRGGTNINGNTFLANQFPITKLLDNFDRAGSTSPPSSSWIQSSITTLSMALANDSATAKVSGTGGNYGGVFWNNETFGPDSEAFVTVKALPAAANVEILTLYARMSGTGSAGTTKGYQLEIDNNATGNVKIEQINGGISLVIGTTGTQLTNVNDSWGLRIMNNTAGTVVTIEAWYKPAGGYWRMVKSIADGSAARVTTSGLIGLESYDNSARFDDFGGGSLSN